LILLPLRGARFSTPLFGGRFGSRFTHHAVRSDYATNLFHLIGFRFPAAWLQVQDFHNAIAGEYVVVASNTFDKAEVLQQRPKIIKPDVRVRTSAQDAIQCLRDFAHSGA
jgi:hypothetical protein